jgi:hypothetical protein
MTRISIALLLALALGSTTPAEPFMPLWSDDVDAETLSPSAREAWDEALRRWDHRDREWALEALVQAANGQAEEPTLWMALTEACLEVAHGRISEESLRHLERATRALDRLDALLLDEDLSQRAERLRSAVEGEQAQITEHLAALELNPLPLSALLPEQAPSPSRLRSRPRDRISSGTSTFSRSRRSRRDLTVDLRLEIGGVTGSPPQRTDSMRFEWH